MNPTPTPDAAADAMNVLTYQQRVLYEAAGMLSEHSDCDDAAYLRKSLARACAIIRDVATRLHAAEQRQWWIPVTERLPEPCVKVLIATKHGAVSPAYLCMGRLAWDNDDWNRPMPVDNASHWMPMPAPPLTPQTTADAPANAANEREPHP